MRVDYTDNPFFDETALRPEMELMQQNNFDRYKHVWLGEYDVRYESKVFANVTIGRVEVTPNTPPRYGMGFGFSTDPNFVLKLYVIDQSHQIYIAAEASGRMPLDQLPELVRAVVRDDGDLIRADKSRPETIDFLRSRGFGGIIPARKGKGSLRAGIEFLQGYQIVINPDCEAMREEARLYSWPTDRLTGRVIAGANPIPAYDHGWDSARYAIEDLITDAPLAEDDGGVLLLPMSKRDRSDLRWHER
jgi:phage terminase large subunit